MISYLPTLDAIPAPVANVSINTNRITNLVDPSAAQDAATQNFVSNAIAAISQTNNSQVISGCGVVWTGNLNFTVAAGSYSINNVTYSISQTNLTLNTADPTNPRFDVIAVNTSNAAVVITGTPAANPLIPTVDPSTQLLLTSVYVPAGASQPGNITNLVQYAEDAGSPTEWNATTNSAGTINLASTNNPHSGTKCIEVTATGSGNYIQLAQGTGTVNLSNYNSLVFYIAPKAGWPSQKSLTISFLNAGTQQGNALTFQNGSFGFVTSNTAYQQIVIPLSNFNIGNTAVNQLKFLTAGGGSTFGFYVDDVSLQAGVMIGSQAFMVWKNAWNSQTAYIANNVVTDGRGLWLCLLPNTNSEPNEGNTNWQWLSSQVNVTRNDYGSFTIPDGGALSQPSQLTLTGSEQLTVSGTGQPTLFDPLNSAAYQKGAYNQPQFLIRGGEYVEQLTQLSLNGNESATLTEDACIFIRNEPSNSPVLTEWDFIGYLSADQTTSSTLAPINGLSYMLANAKNYWAEWDLVINNPGSGSSAITVTFSGSIVGGASSSSAWCAIGPATSTAAPAATEGAQIAASGGAFVATLVGPVKVIASLSVSSPGVIAVQVNTSVAGGGTVRAGSRIKVKQLN